MKHRTSPASAGATWALAAAACALAGCGKTDPPPVAAAVAPEAARTPAGPADASAEQVAREARGAVSCPPRAATPPRADAAPVDDVVGVRPGMGYAEAMNAVLCTDPLLVASPAVGRGFDLKAPQAQSLRQGFSARPAQPRVAQTGRQIVQQMQRDAMARGSNARRDDLQPGQSKWFVGTMGIAGSERVLSVAREERYASDRNPTVDSVVAALVKKYGPPMQMQAASDTRLPLLRWVSDPAGRPVAAGSGLDGRCRGASDPDGAASVSPDCGIVVQAVLFVRSDNPDLVDRLQVGVVDQAGGWRLIAATEQALGQADQQRRAVEVQKATNNAKAPTL